MIIVTGAAGFIGSCLVSRLNADGFYDLVLVDDFSRQDKMRNLENKRYTALVHRDQFEAWLQQNQQMVQFVFHLGARTDTAEFDYALLNRLNLDYSKMVWNRCTEFSIPLVYASSAATYGAGEHGFDDDHAVIPQLKPLNPYGESKNEFDKWVLQQEHHPPGWTGLKFFNVYGPNEYHKGRMASVILHSYRQIQESGRLRLFRSHRPDYPDGGQKRDFVYVKDVVDILMFWMHHRQGAGIYNLGSGTARTFLDLANGLFRALDLEPAIDFIDTPADIRDKYQYFTEANMARTLAAGYPGNFTSLEDGIADYVNGYLRFNRYL